MVDSTAKPVSVSDLQGGQSYWRALYYFNLYRLFLGTGMITVAVTESDFAQLGREDPALFFAASSGMLALAVVSVLTITRGWPAFRIQAYAQLSLDAVLITTMSHASGGIDSGLNLLLIVSVAAGGVVLSGRMSLFFAALATVLTLGQQILESWLPPFPSAGENLIQVGILGIGYFATGWVIYWLAQRFHAMEAEVQAQEAATSRLDRLNEAIVSKSTIGIVVISDDKRSRLVNDQAKRMLGVDETHELPRSLVDKALEKQSGAGLFSFDIRSPVAQIRVQGLPIDEQRKEVALFLEDLAQAEREARNQKLTALGRLTASVAHEIRNPLEAISHAGQLLAESPGLSEQQLKLTGIIDNQSNRIDTIVKSILQLGRPGSIHRVALAIAPWLERFAEGFNAKCGIENAADVEAEDIGVQVDPDQLNQIMTNLCENALVHSRHLSERPLITIRCFTERRHEAVCLDILDRGDGVSEDIRDKIFEPFFTTNHFGLGLGLFLARELAVNNQGELDYIEENHRGRFRLLLQRAHVDKADEDIRVNHG